MSNPLVQLPENEAIHILITKPGAIAGSDGQKEEIAASLPKPAEGKHWVYMPMAVYPLRFATALDADMFLDFVSKKQATDRFFVAPMVYEKQQNKWRVNKAYNEAKAELVVFVQQDVAPVAAPVAAPEVAQ
jgi:hypothetical protein